MDEDPLGHLCDVRRAIYSERDRRLAEAWKAPPKQQSSLAILIRDPRVPIERVADVLRAVRQAWARQAWRSVMALDEATLFDRIFYRAERRGAHRRVH